jgi:xanthine dehydrogenase YagS FAD-binding subunit
VAAFDAALSRSAPRPAAPSYLAGGTTLLDLMKLGVMEPDAVIDINRLEYSKATRIEVTDDAMILGALVRMSTAADHEQLRRDYPIVAQSLMLGASAQLRNMVARGGNVLQRTRCTYFRDIS